MQELSTKIAEEYGIETKHSIMENGEKRFRLVCLKDNSSYNRAESGEKSYWQNSHYHTSIRELYIVQKGEVLFAQQINGKLTIKKFKENEVFQSEPNVPHNVYMYQNAVIHTVKFGAIGEPDWIPCEELDEILENININEYV